MFSFLIHLLIQFHLLTLSIFYNRFDKATTFIEPFLWPVGVAVGDLCSHLQWYVVGTLISPRSCRRGSSDAEVWLAQGPVSNEWLSWDSKTGLSDSRAYALKCSPRLKD